MNGSIDEPAGTGQIPTQVYRACPPERALWLKPRSQLVVSALSGNDPSRKQPMSEALNTGPGHGLRPIVAAPTQARARAATTGAPFAESFALCMCMVRRRRRHRKGCP